MRLPVSTAGCTVRWFAYGLPWWGPGLTRLGRNLIQSHYPGVRLAVRPSLPKVVPFVPRATP